MFPEDIVLDHKCLDSIFYLISKQICKAVGNPFVTWTWEAEGCWSFTELYDKDEQILSDL